MYVYMYVFVQRWAMEDKKQGQGRRDRDEGKSRGKEERKEERASFTVMEETRSK